MLANKPPALPLNSRISTSANTWHGFVIPQIQYVLAYSDFLEFEIGENSSEVWLQFYLYSISDGRACWANDDHERRLQGTEFEVLQKANCLGVLWSMGDILCTNHSLLFIKAGVLKSSSHLVPVIIYICKWRNNISFHIAHNSNFCFISTGLAFNEGKARFHFMYFKSYSCLAKFKWLWFPKRTLTQDGEGGGNCTYWLAATCEL